MEEAAEVNHDMDGRIDKQTGTDSRLQTDRHKKNDETAATEYLFHCGS